MFAATQRRKRLVVIVLLNFMQNQVLALQETVDSHSIFRDPEKSVHRYRHGSQDRTRGYETGTLSTRTINNCDDEVGRRGELVAGRVCPKAEDARQQSDLRGRVLVHRQQEREPDRVGGASNGWKQSSWTGLQTASCCATWTVSKCELRRIKQNGLTMPQVASSDCRSGKIQEELIQAEA